MDHGHGAPDSCWAIVVAGGSGSRFSGEVPKQYLTLGDRRVLDWALGSMRSWFGERLVLVVPAARVHDREPLAGIVVAGGATRSDSVRAGLAVLPPDARFVMVHDGARPLIDDRVVADLLNALMNGAACVVPGLAVTDTVKRVRDGEVVETLERSGLVAVQTPQGFSVDVLRRVHTREAQATDDAALVERDGGRTMVVEG